MNVLLNKPRQFDIQYLPGLHSESISSHQLRSPPGIPINSAHNKYLLSRGVVGDYADLNLTIYRSIYQSILLPSLHDLHGKSTSKSKSVLLFPSLTNICFHPSSKKRPRRKPHFFLSRKAMRYNRRDGCWKLSVTVPEKSTGTKQSSTLAELHIYLRMT